jgi:hypothetical protein
VTAAQHIIVVRYGLDGVPSYRPYGACECGWCGPLRSSYVEAELDARWHRVAMFQPQRTS